MTLKRLSIALLCMCSVAFAKVPYINAVPNEFILKLESRDFSSGLKKIRGFSFAKALDASETLFHVKTKRDFSLAQMKTFFKEAKGIEYIEPNFIYHKTNHDPLLGKLWGLHNTGDNEPPSNSGNSSPTGVAGSDIKAFKAWQLTKGSKKIKIAIIDTGIDYNHEDLRENIWVNEQELNGLPGVDDDNNGYVDDIHGYDFANKDGDPLDGNGHGTHCAGTIGAVHNSLGVAGVMGEVQLVAVKFLQDDGSGTSADAIMAIDYARKLGVDIMSNSWGGGGFSNALKEAIEKASDDGILFTAAAGNDATDNNSVPHYPSSYNIKNVVSVAAHNYNDNLASFSCYGSKTVHVSAPGRNILSTLPGNTYGVYSGTSMATPHVTGVLGLYLSLHGRKDLDYIRNLLMESSDYVPALGRKSISGGRVNAYNFLQEKRTSRPPTPEESKWKKFNISRFETPHPYIENSSLQDSFSITGAKFIRAHIQKMDLENGFDFLYVLDSSQKIENLTGKRDDFYSDYIEGDTIHFNFESDRTVQKWGVLVDWLEYQ